MNTLTLEEIVKAATKETNKKHFTEEQKDGLIRHALENTEGRVELGEMITNIDTLLQGLLPGI